VVFLAGDFVYKLKKPVRFAFVDMSRLAERLHFCEEEVRLNRRLSPDLYLGVVPITESPAGMRVGGECAPLEYAVHMRRLPEERMMDRLLRWRALGRPMVERLAEHIAEFHARATTGPDLSKYGSPEAVGALWEEHFAQTARFVGRTLSRFQDGRLRATVSAWLTRKHGELSTRVDGGRIRDVHGDLRTSAAVSEAASLGRRKGGESRAGGLSGPARRPGGRPAPCPSSGRGRVSGVGRHSPEAELGTWISSTLAPRTGDHVRSVNVHCRTNKERTAGKPSPALRVKRARRLPMHMERRPDSIESRKICTPPGLSKRLRLVWGRD
jgi:hypothetical protein